MIRRGALPGTWRKAQMGQQQAANPFVVASVRVVRPTSAQALPVATSFYIRYASAGPAVALSAMTLLSALFPLGATLRQLLHVRVELLLVLGRQRRTNLGVLPVSELLHLVTISL